MDALTSFELDKNWNFPLPPSDQLLFPRSSQLTDLHVTLGCFTDCIHLLRQLGFRLSSFTVGLILTPPKTFSHVTTLFLFDDVKPFEHVFFERLVRTLPHLRTLEINNELAQGEKLSTGKNNVGPIFCLL